MLGKLYVIGVGPGDPELLTLKAMRIIKEVPCICVPKGKEEGSSLALLIVQSALSLDGKEIIEAYFPMIKSPKTIDNQITEATSSQLSEKWRETTEVIKIRLNKGIDVAFLTIGDPTIYSTFFYLYDYLVNLNPRLTIEIIPGVSSINASAARVGMSLALADEKIAILPATYTEDIKEILQRFDTIILMKVHKVFNNILKILNEMRLIDKAIYISNATMNDERIFKDIQNIKEGDLNYFSLILIKK